MSDTLITPVILAGGSGTRLWPLSRKEQSKQFLPLLSDKTMLQETLDRVGGGQFSKPLLVGGAAQAEALEEYDANLMLEPMARNTAPAIALAALALPEDAPMLVMPSDHVIADVAAFEEAVGKAAALARDGWLLTFGITPTGPETGYGYIQMGWEIEGGCHRVKKFIEKPDLETAKAYVNRSGYFWNGGIFLFTAGAYLTALAEHAPEIEAACRAAMANGDGKPVADAFADSPSISIDYAVMEKADRVAVVPVDMGWSDIGSWDALHEISEADGDGNALSGDTLAIDTANSLVRTDGPLVTTIGVEDLIVVATEDSVLVMKRGESQRVKEAVEALKAKDSDKL